MFSAGPGEANAVKVTGTANELRVRDDAAADGSAETVDDDVLDEDWAPMRSTTVTGGPSLRVDVVDRGPDGARGEHDRLESIDGVLAWKLSPRV